MLWENVEDDHTEPRTAQLVHAEILDAFRLLTMGHISQVAALVADAQGKRGGP